MKSKGEILPVDIAQVGNLCHGATLLVAQDYILCTYNAAGRRFGLE
jgi:hypothetical protein